jgi:hypothetical protein
MREKFVTRGLDARIHPLRKKFFGLNLVAAHHCALKR